MNATKYIKQFELYDAFIDGLVLAKKYDLEAEYIEWLFRDLKVNKDRLTKATRDALLNWDDDMQHIIQLGELK